MKELGQELKENRLKNSLSLEEVSSDLNIQVDLLDNLEEGNIKAFKDLDELKSIILEYSKYLGLDSEKLLDKFHDFLFEFTTKINIKDIEKINSIREEERIKSPYTAPRSIEHIHEYSSEFRIAMIVGLILLFILFLLFIKLFLIDKNMQMLLEVL